MPKFSPSTMGWGALSHQGFYITLTQGNVDWEKYSRILDGHLPYPDALYPDGWVLQQPWARAHNFEETWRWMSEQGSKNFNGLPTAATCIENLWSLMKRTIEREAPKSKPDLEASIRRVARQISRKAQVQLKESFPQRFDVCVNLDGEVFSSSPSRLIQSSNRRLA